jgi:GMP synthase (glutamine-hydrolysing)
MSKRVILVRHGEDPADDRVFTWLVANGFEPVLVHPHAGEGLPVDTTGIAGSVIYGGRYPAYETDRNPFLDAEYAWIDRCIAQDLPLLGICLGAQMIAWRLGADVGPSPQGWHEFGCYEIIPTQAGRDILPGPIHVVQAHYHTFSLPPGAEHLATSALFANQAFRVGGRIYGFQFHPEVTIEGFRRSQDAPHANYGMPGAQTRAEQDVLLARQDARQADWFHGFLRQLLSPAA